MVSFLNLNIQNVTLFSAPVSRCADLEEINKLNPFTGSFETILVWFCYPVLLSLAFSNFASGGDGNFEDYTATVFSDGGGVQSRGFWIDAWFVEPADVAMDSEGNLYIADSGQSTICKISPDGTHQTFAGGQLENGSADSGRDGQGTQATFAAPEGVAVDDQGNVYVADTRNHTIRKITPGGLVSTLAGKAGEVGTADGEGAVARFYRPTGITVGSDGTVYVADSWNASIRKITPEGIVSTLAGVSRGFGDRSSTKSIDGVGSVAEFGRVDAITFDNEGDLLVTGSYHHVIRKVTLEGQVTTIAGVTSESGSNDGSSDEARFDEPSGIAVDSYGRIYVSDPGNRSVRMIDAEGIVTTIAEFFTYEKADGDQEGIMDTPHGLIVAPNGTVFVTSGSKRVRDNRGGSKQIIALTPKKWPPFEEPPVEEPVEVVEGRLVNMSVNTFAGLGEESLVAGFVVEGSTPKSFLIRGIGPELANFGVTGTLADPELTLIQDGNLIAQNRDWAGEDGRELGAFTLSEGSKDSAIWQSLESGVYTVSIAGADLQTGIGLIEIYDASVDERTSELLNLSARVQINRNRTVITGFVIEGEAPMTLVIRAIGPGLQPYGVVNTASDPKLTLYQGQTAIESNDDWSDADARELGAFPLVNGSKDSVLQVTLDPGAYTIWANTTEDSDASGIVLIEVYVKK